MHALIPAAGSGTRLGAAEPKQYLPLAGEPMLVHSVRALLGCPELRSVTVVVRPGDTRAGECLRADARLRIVDCGGATRAASVRAGLESLLEAGARPQDWVLVHDAARCCVSVGAVRRLIEACEHDAVGGLLALPVADTLKRQRGDSRRVGATLSREGLWQAQTPQMFRIGLLLEGLRRSDALALTDESSVIESQGLQPLLVEGEPDNFKVTLPGDLRLAEALLLRRRAAQPGRGGQR